MKPVKFDEKKDLAPIPFDEKTCRMALKMKEAGLIWHPHVGGFAWDPDGVIPADSPFPNRVYFILSLPRFVEILGSVERISQKLVWLPTFHQARLLLHAKGISDEQIQGVSSDQRNDHIRIYGQIVTELKLGNISLKKQ